MSKQFTDPAFLFYSSDFLTGTLTFTDEQVGKYIRALCLQHQKGSLSERELKKITSGDQDIMDKFEVLENGRYANIRLVTETQKRRENAERKREKIQAWRDRQKNGAGGEKSNADVTVTETLHNGSVTNQKPFSQVEPKIESVSVIENEIEIENGDRGGMGEKEEKTFLVPRIISGYADIFPDFIRDTEKDPRSAMKIINILTDNARIDQINHDQLLDIWRNICIGIRDKKAVQFYSGNGLTTIANNLPTIIQKIRTNGNSKTNRTYSATDFED